MVYSLCIDPIIFKYFSKQIGRSNVGKSSLINALTADEIAKVAKRPGKTNYLQYIYVPEIGISIVDCPGYGHANKSSKEIKDWAKMLEEYIAEGK